MPPAASLRREAAGPGRCGRPRPGPRPHGAPLRVRAPPLLSLGLGPPQSRMTSRDPSLHHSCKDPLRTQSPTHGARGRAWERESCRGAAIRPRTAGMSRRASRRHARQARVGPPPPPAGPPHPGAGPPRPEPTLPGSRGPVPATSSGHTVQCHCPPEARPASRSTPTFPRPVARLGPTRVSERSNVRLQSGGRGARQSQYNRDVDVAEWGGGSGGPGAVCGRTRERRGRPHCAQARRDMGGLEMGDGGSWEGPPSVLGAGWCSGLIYGVSEGPRLGPSPHPLEGSQSCSLGD